VGDMYDEAGDAYWSMSPERRRQLHREVAEYEAEADDFDGPIGDGPQGARMVHYTHPSQRVVASFGLLGNKLSEYSQQHWGVFSTRDAQIRNTARRAKMQKSTEARIRELMNVAQEALELVAHLKNRPKEPIGHGVFPPVILFKKRFDGSADDTEYDYVFIRAADGHWYGTGRATRAYTWDGLLDWLEKSGPLPIIYVATGFQEYYDPEASSDDE
jgi:hypothetical protein